MNIIFARAVSVIVALSLGLLFASLFKLNFVAILFWFIVFRISWYIFNKILEKE